MKTKAELNEGILLLIEKIKEENPELIKFIPEMPDNNVSDMENGVSITSLKEYYDSLEILHKDYKPSHEE